MNMRIKIVAIVDESIARMLREHPEVIPKGKDQYTETLLLQPKGAYGAPELIAIRVRGEMDERAIAVHLGHDLRNQEESLIEQGEKDRLMYKYMQLNFQPIGEFSVVEEYFRYKEFFLRLTTYDKFGMFLTIERKFPGENTHLFAEKQRRAMQFLRELGIGSNSIIDVDVRGLVVLSFLRQALEGKQGEEQG